jgi:hypothetical protein
MSLEHLPFITRRSRVVHIARRRRSLWEPLADLPSDASELARATPDALVSAGSIFLASAFCGARTSTQRWCQTVAGGRVHRRGSEVMV